MVANHFANVFRVASICAITALAIPMTTLGGDFRIVPAEGYSTVFAGETLNWSVNVIGDHAPEGALQWSHTAGTRTLARGEQQLESKGNNASAATITLQMPDVRESVVLATMLSLKFVPQDAKEASTSLEHRLTLFRKDPLSQRQKWSDELDVKLFDDSGKTAAAFDEIKLPYKTVRNARTLHSAEEDGVLIIGEGTSLTHNRTLAESALQAASAGRRVILLAPVDGELPLPGTGDHGLKNVSAPGELRFCRADIIRQLDKRLDSVAWTGCGNSIPLTLLTIESRGGRVEARVSDANDGWPWLEIRFPQTKGVLVVCGFHLVKEWNSSPTPRYLLVRMLESMSEDQGD